jgi:hypothetical protein
LDKDEMTDDDWLDDDEEDEDASPQPAAEESNIIEIGKPYKPEPGYIHRDGAGIPYEKDTSRDWDTIGRYHIGIDETFEENQAREARHQLQDKEEAKKREAEG